MRVMRGGLDLRRFVRSLGDGSEKGKCKNRNSTAKRTKLDISHKRLLRFSSHLFLYKGVHGCLKVKGNYNLVKREFYTCSQLSW